MTTVQHANLGGVYRGICKSNRDPEQRLRIKVAVPQLMGGTELGDWAEACLPPGWSAGLVKDHGTPDGVLKHALQRKVPVPGQTVWVMFEGGDIDHPVWMGVA